MISEAITQLSHTVASQTDARNFVDLIRFLIIGAFAVGIGIGLTLTILIWSLA